MIRRVSRAAPLLALLFVLTLSAPTRAQLVDAQLVAGHQFSGQLEDAVDIDIVALEGLAAEVLTIQVKADKGGPSDLLVELVDVTNDTVVASASGEKPALKKIELPGTGLYHVRISSPTGRLGPYTIKTKGKVDKGALAPASAPAAGGNAGSIEVKFQGRQGMELKASVKASKGTGAQSGQPTLVGPFGSVDLSAYTKLKNGKLSLKKVPIAAWGEWTLTVPNVGGPGTLDAKTTLKTKAKGKHAEGGQSAYNFGGDLALSDDVLFVGETTTLTALVALTDASTLPDTVYVARSTSTGEEYVASMWDDGVQAGHFDEIEGDEIFTAQFQVTPDTDENQNYHVVVAYGGGKVARSLGVDVLVVTPPTLGELQAALDENAARQATVDQALLDGTLAPTLFAMLTDLQSDPGILEAGPNDSGLGIWAIDEHGIPLVVYAPADGVKGGGSAGLDVAAPAVDEEPISVRSNPFAPVAVPGVDRLVDWAPYADLAKPKPKPEPSGLPIHATMPAGENVVGSNKVIGIAAQYFDWGEGDDVPAMIATLQDEPCFDVTYHKDTSKGSGSVERFKGLGNYGVVLISSHGDSFFAGADAGQRFGWNNAASGVVIVHSNMAITVDNVDTYLKDLLKGRLIVWGDHYGMTPTFMTRYSGKMPNSLVYTSICRGAFNATLANAFLGQGAGAFLSYSDYVAVSFCEDNGPPLLDTLLEPDTTLDDAFTAGLTEVDADPAEFKLFGSKTLALRPGLKDGSFESGNIEGAWTRSGDARIIPALSKWGPTDGDRVGIISTGLGFTTTFGSLSQVLCLGAEDDFLVFDWAFFSEEFIEWCYLGYEDELRVKIKDVQTGVITELFSTDIDQLCDSVVPTTLHFDAPPDDPFDPSGVGVWTTGWRSSALALPESLKGKQVEITFICKDTTDSLWDSAVLLDNIELQ